MASLSSHGVNATVAALTTPNSSPINSDSNSINSDNPSSADNVVVASVILTLLIVVTISGNLLVCVAFQLCRPLRIVTNYFVVSLSVADLLVGFVCMPFWFLYLIRGWPESNSTVYTLWMCLDIVSGTASIMNLAAISMDRYCAITYPFEYHAMLTKRRARLCIVFVWFYALIIALLRVARRGSWYAYFVATASFFVPLPTMIFSYIRILNVALKQARTTIRLGSFPESFNDFSEASPTTDVTVSSQNRKSRASSGGARQGPSNSKSRFSQSSIRQMRRRFSTELKAAKTLAIVMGTFIFCWAPFIITMLIVSCTNCVYIDFDITKAIKWLHYSNSAMNPIIYTVLNRNFRDAFRRILCRFESRVGGGCASFGHLLPRNTSRSSHGSVNGVRFSLKTELQVDTFVCVEKVTVV